VSEGEEFIYPECVRSSGVVIPSPSSLPPTAGTKNSGLTMAMRWSESDEMSRSAASWETFATDTTGY
jgi:hypothetical protein